MSALKSFCNQLVAFFEDLAETYPEEPEIMKAVNALKLMKHVNPRYIYTSFMENVYNEFSQRILAEDEEYILQRAKTILNTEHKDINFAFWIFDKHWSTMTETNKLQIWRYVKSLILLAQRV